MSDLDLKTIIDQRINEIEHLNTINESGDSFVATFAKKFKSNTINAILNIIVVLGVLAFIIFLFQCVIRSARKRCKHSNNRTLDISRPGYFSMRNLTSSSN